MILLLLHQLLFNFVWVKCDRVIYLWKCVNNESNSKLAHTLYLITIAAHTLSNDVHLMMLYLSLLFGLSKPSAVKM